jgi:hypothetical protein
MAKLPARLLGRTAKLSPAARALLVADVAWLAARRVAGLEARDRARLGTLLAGALRERRLAEPERRELAALVAKLEPRAFAGDVAKRVSPLPLPDRLAYGRRHRR